MSWTDERIATLTKMWKEGKSAADIAKVLGKGVTRNAVIGKAHRMSLSGRPSPIKKPAAAAGAKKATGDSERQESAAVKKAPVRAKTGAEERKSAPAEDAPARPAAARPGNQPQRSRLPSEHAPRHAHDNGRGGPDAVIPGGGIAMLDLTERMCKWPIGDPRDDDFNFCGSPIRIGTPYCPGHAALAYQASARGRAAAAAAAQAKAEEAEEEEPAIEAEEEDDAAEEGAVA